MISFSIHFIFCNLFISVMILAILLAKKLLKKHLSSTSQYRIWYLLPVILLLPFLSIRPAGILQVMRWLPSLHTAAVPRSAVATTPSALLSSADWIYDVQNSVTRTYVSPIRFLPLILWVGGICLILTGMLIARIRLYQLEQSALPLQNPNIRLLYDTCRKEMQIRRKIPVYSTAFLHSPVIVGAYAPRIYLPIHLISEEKISDLRYMLLHELQHYKQKDAILNGLMNLAIIVYWFNPMVWLALKEIRTDREVACDTFVLHMLTAEDYLDYGNTLLNFAQKISKSPFSLSTGIGGNANQIRKRILNIAHYKPQNRWCRCKECLVFTLLVIFLLESTAWIPVRAAAPSVSLPKDAIIQTEDLSDFFGDYEGCFVLYDMAADAWEIYNPSHAATRFSPDSTYKIYSALFALEQQTITPAASELSWDGQTYPYPEWNADQTLTSAMQHSVNWYFQELDRRADWEELKTFYQTIDYGNQDLSGGVSEFWMESSLQISAIEQVELLKNLYTNAFHLEEDHIQTVKDSLKLSATSQAVLSGKTGTGILNGEKLNGWFIGYVEDEHNTYFFATNIQGDANYNGLSAAEITRDILATKEIYSDSK